MKIGLLKLQHKLEIDIEGDGCRVLIEGGGRIGKLRIACKRGGSAEIGEKTTIEEAYILADSRSVSIGRDCMLSFQVNVRTTDAHGIYNLATGELTNRPDSVSIGHHVWIAQGAIVSKGSVVGDNSVIGARAYVQKANIPPNCVASGTPAKVLRTGTIWDRRMTDNIYADDADTDAGLWNHVERPEPQNDV